MKHVLFFAGLFLSFISHPQTCDQFPADCPDEGMIEASQDSSVCINNLIIPQEISMQNNLRKMITDMMEETAKKKNWKVYEYIEIHGSGIGTEDNAKPLPYSYRRPYQYTITFDFIVNEDSLLAWQNWYKNDLKKRADQVVESYQQSDNSSEQPFADSSMYYGKLLTKYVNDHAEQYQKAVLANDAKYLKRYDEDLKRIQDKIDRYINKANSKQDDNLSTANNKNEDLQSYKERSNIAFRSASTLRASFIFNDDVTPSLDDVRLIKTLPVPNSSFAALFHNPDPDPTQSVGSFATNPDFAFLLLGKWITKQDQYHTYRANYFFDKKAMDVVTIKKIPCDKLQTIFVGLEGSPKYINQFIENFEIQKLNALIVTQ